MNHAPVIVAIVGATATGKSAVSLAVARALDAEIINADSMQFYRGMDIGTAKVTLDERAGIAHHQIDTLDVHEDASVATYQAEARAHVEAIHARGHRVVVVGGSGLYVRALLDHFEFPATDAALRADLERRAHEEGPGILHRELTKLDPEAGEKISPKNAKRIVRALEVVTLTGEPFSSSLPSHAYAAPAVQVAFELAYPALDARIAQRVERMWSDGLVDEVRGLASRGLRESVTARRAVGYAETLRHLDGELNADATRDLIAQHTRRLARRQRRWFMPDPRVTWVDAPQTPDDVDRAASDVLSVVASHDVP